MPLADLRLTLDRDELAAQAIQRLARELEVGTLLALRRLFDAGWIDEDKLWRTYGEELERLKQFERSTRGGDFYRTLGARTGKRFARALVASTLEGQTLLQDAFRLLGVRKSETFYRAARKLGGGRVSYLLDANLFIQAKNLQLGLATHEDCLRVGAKGSEWAAQR
jgi:hypothetical protein